MTCDATIGKMIDLFRKVRDIHDPKVIRNLQGLRDKRISGDELSFDD